MNRIYCIFMHIFQTNMGKNAIIIFRLTVNQMTTWIIT